MSKICVFCVSSLAFYFCYLFPRCFIRRTPDNYLEAGYFLPFYAILRVILSNPQHNECKQCKILFTEIITKKQSVKFLNNYKGITLNHSGNLVFYKDGILKVKVSQTQMVAAIYEKQIVIDYNETYILCKLVDANTKMCILTLNDAKIIHYHKRSSLNKRIDVDQNFKTTIGFKTELIEVEPLDISYKFIAFKYSKKLHLQKDDTIDLTIGFEINGPSSLIHEKKFTKIFAKGKIIRIDVFNDLQKFVIELEIKKAGQNIFKNYLQQREIAVIKEFKQKMKLSNG